MKNNIPFYINRLLLSQSKVFVPGLGTFAKHYFPSKWSDDHTSISAPYFSSEFLANGGKGDSSLIDYLIYIRGISKKEAGVLILDFVKEVEETISAHGIADISSFGIFSNKGGLVHFKSNAFSKWMGFGGLDEVTLNKEAVIQEPIIVAEPNEEKPIETIATEIKLIESRPDGAEDNQVIIPIAQKDSQVRALDTPRTYTTFFPTESNFRKSRDNQWMGRILAMMFGIVLLLLVASALYLMPKFSVDPILKGQAIDKVDSLDNDLTLNGQAIDALDSVGAIPAQTWRDSLIGGDVVKDNKDNLDVEDSVDSVANLNGEGDDRINDIKIDKNDGTAETTEEILSGNENEIITCMIVVGAFGESSNAKSMMTTLKNLGYEPYQMNRVGLTHVGVRKNCRTSELREVLYHVRSQISSEAWVLRIAND